MAFRRRDSLPRSAALIALGALALHQLRYLVATGGHPAAALAAQGHGYMASAVPVLVAFALAALLAGLLRALAGREPGKSDDLRRRTLGLATAIFCVFAVQESLEGILEAGHASGIGAVFGAGGWTAVPLALLVGVACAITERRIIGLERLVAVAVRARRPGRPRPERRQPRPRAIILAPSASPLAIGLASRPPPLLSLPH